MTILVDNVAVTYTGNLDEQEPQFGSTGLSNWTVNKTNKQICIHNYRIQPRIEEEQEEVAVPVAFTARETDKQNVKDGIELMCPCWNGMEWNGIGANHRRNW